MARADSAPVPVMHDGAAADAARERPTARSEGHTATANGKGAKKARKLSGPWGASFDGTAPDGTPPAASAGRAGTPRRASIPTTRSSGSMRTAGISNESGKSVFEQKDVEVPKAWSQLATNVVVSKYFRGHVGTPERETQRPPAHRPRRQLHRGLGRDPALLRDRPRTSQSFKAELTHLLVNQKMAFNSPVWFNVGIEPKPQCSACFINSVQDNMGSIMDLAKTEAMLFKFGSRRGQQPLPHPLRPREDDRRRHRLGPGQLHEGLRRLRRRREVGRQDPPRGQDGHPRRRPSRCPRLHRFQDARGEEGLGPHRAGLRPELHRRGLRQRLLPERQPLRPRDRRLHARGRGPTASGRPTRSSTASPMGTYKARDIFRRMADAAHLCGDPGIQYDTTINDWHTSANTDKIYASPTRAPSTCSSTTRPATWPASTS